MNCCKAFYKKNIARIIGCLAAICFVIAIPKSISAQTWYRQNGGTITQSNQLYYTTLTDTMGIYVYNLGVYTLTNSRIRKSGNTSNTDSSSFYGRNAAVLAKTGSITLTGDSITANGIGVNGAFACYPGSSITLNNDTISCTGDFSHGIEATVGATITATNCIITTTGGKGASAIATDCGGGTINVSGGSATTSQLLAAGIYSTGTITATGTNIMTAVENACVIDGKNSITLNNCNINSGMNGIKIYESGPGDTAHGSAQFTINGGVFNSSMHSVYIGGNHGTKATVVIKGGTTLNPGTGYIVYTDSGANLMFTADSETMAGNIFADSSAFAVDTLSATVQNHTMLTGIITNAALNMDASSKWYLTGTSHITTLINSAGVDTITLSVNNIIGNGNSVYYRPSLPGNSWLHNKSYALQGGGCLLPEAAICTYTSMAKLPGVEEDIKLYPNPVLDRLIISYPSSDVKTTIIVTGLEGRILVKKVFLPGNTTNMDLSAFPKGFYILRVENSNGIKTKKFVKD